jgi:hypothetical protein
MYLSEKSAKRSVDTETYHIGLIEPWLGTLELVADARWIAPIRNGVFTAI